MRYILASDYDGTLRKNKVISDKNRNAIKKFREKGNLFGIVTGRDYKSITTSLSFDNFQDYDFLITANGAVCYGASEEILYSHTVDSHTLWKDSFLSQQIIKKTFEFDVVHCGISFDISNYTFSPLFPDGGEDGVYNYDNHKHMVEQHNFSRMFVRCKSQEESKAIAKALTDEFGSVVNPTQNGTAIDMPATGIDKAKGIMEYANLMNVDYPFIWTVGNHYNDLPMLNNFQSCLMSDGVEELKKSVNYVCDDVCDFIEIILNNM